MVLFAFQLFSVMLTDCPKRPCQEQCIIDMCEDVSNLITPKDIDSWKTLLKAADIQNCKPGVLEAAKTVDKGAIPTSVMYHRKCRSLFTMKQLNAVTCVLTTPLEALSLRETVESLVFYLLAWYHRSCYCDYNTRPKKKEQCKHKC